METKGEKKETEVIKENPGSRVLVELSELSDEVLAKNAEVGTRLYSEFTEASKKIKEWGNKIANVYTKALHEHERRKQGKPAIMTREEEESLKKEQTFVEAAEESLISGALGPDPILTISTDRLPDGGALEEKMDSAVMGTSFLQRLGFLSEGVSLGALYNSLPAPEKGEKFNSSLEHELRWGGRPTRISKTNIIGFQSSELPGVIAEVDVASGKSLRIDLIFGLDALAMIAEGYLAGEI